MSQSLKQEVQSHGFAFSREYFPEMDTAAIASELGRSLTPWQGGLMQELVPRNIATPNTYSGMYGLDRFPFHTDLAHWRQPPRYLLLRCLKGYSDIPTLLLDGQAIFDTTMLNILTRAIFKPRRPLGGTSSLLRLCTPIENGYCFRWDEAFLKPASKIGEMARQHITELLPKCVPLSIALIRTGDTLLIDNWRMLHARSLVPTGRENRRIQRVYLEDLH